MTYINKLKNNVGRFLQTAILALVVTTGLLPAVASAINPSLYKQLQTPFYDPNSSNACGGGASSVGSDNADTVGKYLISRGMSPVATGALMGNFKSESGFSPTAENSTSHAYGLVQWLGGRLTSLHSFADADTANRPVSDLSLQLEFMWKELSGSYKSNITDVINAPNATIEAATQTVYDYYEGLFGSGQGSVSERTKDAIVFRDRYASGSNGGGSISGCTCTVSPGTPAAGVNLNISTIVNKYSLQSVLVKQVGGSAIASNNESKPPDSPASVMKLVIADVFLHTNPDLSKLWTVKSQELYGVGDTWSVGTKVSLDTVLKETLNINSSNTGANILIDAAGGRSSANASAHSLGYEKTDIVAYYNNKPTGNNKTTVTDLTKVMEKIYTASGRGYKVAQDALKENYFHIDPAPLAAKWGMNGSVTGNSGVFEVGGSKYIITLYINRSGASTAIKDATEDIIAAIGNMTTGAGGTSTTGCTGVSAMLQLVQQYAWPSQHTPAVEPNQVYLDATNKASSEGKYTGASGGGYAGIDCGAFVTRVMQNSGVDPDYGGGGNTIYQEQWLKDHPVKYQAVSANNIADLQPGDIAIKQDPGAHTFIYVGSLGGFNGNIASSSLGKRAPSAGTLDPNSLKEFTWYRLK